MRIRVGSVLAALGFFAAALATSRADDGALLKNRLQTFVVEVCTSDRHAAAIGGAVVVARTGDVLTLATAEHIVAQKGTLRVLDSSRQGFYEILGIRSIDAYDVALLRVRAQAFPAEPVEPAAAVAGEAVHVWGHTGDAFWQLATGSVRDPAAQPSGIAGAPRITIACSSCSYGDSGSGVFDDRGRLLGILTRAWSAKSGGPVLFIEVEPASLIVQEVRSDLATQR